MLHALVLAITIVAHDAGYVTSLANHIARWLAGEKIAATVVNKAQMSPSLAHERLAFLVGFDAPTPNELAVLRAYRARGGRLVVFHSGSPALGALMGVKPLGYAKAPYAGAWSRMDFVKQRPAGIPSAIRQTSTVLHRAMPEPGKGRVLATWSDRNGRTTGEPAWIATSAGYWMTHVLLADGDEDLKAQMLAALVASVDPAKWSAQVHAARLQNQTAALRNYAISQVPRKGEIRAVWDHSGCGLYPGNWPKTIRTLKETHVSDLFLNVAGGGFAHYPSALLPRSKTCRDEGDQLAAALAAAQGSGLRVHAWVMCFTATRGAPDTLRTYAKRGWRLRTAKGNKLTEFLDPANPNVRTLMLNVLDEIQARYAVHGIHLDFVRWGDGVVKPKQASDCISRFVAEARRHVRRPRWLTTAVYGKYPSCIASVGQDWCGWIDSGLVDYVVPMDYTESTAKFGELLDSGATSRLRARRMIAGIGVTANESRLDATRVIDQINMARRRNLAGVALFDLDVTLERQILPYLRLGIWRE